MQPSTIKTGALMHKSAHQDGAGCQISMRKYADLFQRKVLGDLVLKVCHQIVTITLQFMVKPTGIFFYFRLVKRFNTNWA
jgi:hypothetical protein